MTAIRSVTLEVPDPTAAAAFYTAAFGLGPEVAVRAATGASTGFRWFTLSLLVAQPSTVDSLVGTAIEAGATVLKPVKKSFWGYGGVVQAPDGTVWKVASSSKKNTAPANRTIDQIVLLLGAEDVIASKQFYLDHGLVVAKSFGRKYVEFTRTGSSIGLALLGRSALAKDAGVPAEGTGSHRISIGSEAGAFADPDGFSWAASSVAAS
jgi:predicted lactoylglutathione lyase